jgi:hypothetical protein
VEAALPMKFRPAGLFFEEELRSPPLAFTGEMLHWHLLTLAAGVRNFIEFKCALEMLERRLPLGTVKLLDCSYDGVWQSFLVCHSSIWRDATDLYDAPYRRYAESGIHWDPAMYGYISRCMAEQHWEKMDLAERLLLIAEVDRSKTRCALMDDLPRDDTLTESVITSLSHIWN